MRCRYVSAVRRHLPRTQHPRHQRERRTVIREMRGWGIKRATRVGFQDGVWSESVIESGGFEGGVGGDDGALGRVSESESGYGLRRCESGIAAASVWL